MEEKSRQKGFTLIELIVSITLFLVIMVISMGAILGIFDANRKARSLKIVLDSLNLSVETMSREIRFGKLYHCGTSGVLTEAHSCPDLDGDDFLSFLSSSNEQITYRFINSSIEKSVGSGDYIPVTASEAVIDDIDFYVFGAENTDTLQPKVVIMIQGHAGSDTKGGSHFTLQTLVSQKLVDW